MRQEFGKGFKGLRAKLGMMAVAVALSSAMAGSLVTEVRQNDPDSYPMLASLLALVLVVAASVIGSMLVGGRILRPLLRLKTGTETLTSGNIVAIKPLDSRSEIGALGETFNGMVSSLKENVSRLRTLAYQDSVTGLSNRTVLSEVLSEASHFSGGAVISIDLDRFNEVNQAFGHHTGDALLLQVAERLLATSLGKGKAFEESSNGRLFQSFEGDSMLFRSVADEFVAVILRPSTDVELAKIADAMVTALSKPFHLSGSEIRIGGSIGIVRIGRDASLPEELSEFADLAMAQAKEMGGSRYVFFNENLRAAAARRARLERDIKFAIPNDELVVHFQPKVSASDGTLMGVEALVRWQHPSKGLLYPGDFLPIAENKGMMSELGRKVFELSARQIREWQSHGLWTRVAINVCPTQFMNANFADEFISLAKSMGVRPQQFVLEITETVAMQNSDAANVQLSKLKDAGFRIAIDDFGVGYSNLAQLYKMQFDFIKIDRSLIEHIDTDVHAQRIIGFTIGMAHEMGKQVVAEGIETEGQHRELQKLGCDYAQGFLFGKPMPGKDIVERYCPKSNVEYLRVAAA